MEYSDIYETKKGKKIKIQITTNTPSPQALANLAKTVAELCEEEWLQVANCGKQI